VNQNWVQLVIGVWILISPWILGFSSISVMMWSNLLCGTAVMLINLWIIFGNKPENPNN